MIIKRFSEQVARTPEKLIFNTGQGKISFMELDALSNRVARAVADACQSIQANSNGGHNISLLFENGIHMIYALLGVLKAGKTYVPLDVSFPESRLHHMCNHSQSSLILTNRKNIALAGTLQRLSNNTTIVIVVEEVITAAHSNLPVEREVQTDGAAYILYTSGSTGKPKGVVQSHENVVYFADQWCKRFNITQADHLLLLASFSHDGAVPDIYSALLSGARLSPYNVKDNPDLANISGLLITSGITVWHSVPTLYRYFTRQLENEVFPKLRLVVLGGEAVREDDVTLFLRHFPTSRFANIYGQSESTINSIWMLEPSEIDATILLGEPIDDLQMMLVDDDGEEVGDMGTGEIVVAGNHVALGYWNDDEASKKVFGSHQELGKLYWTGDMGRYTADGHIVFVGRKDAQIKIRGYRVEPGEIESVLLQLEGVTEAVVMLRDNPADSDGVGGTGEQVLCLYAVAADGCDQAGMIDFLADRLPSYMIPAFVIPMAELPRTPSGKIHRTALPEPQADFSTYHEYEAPRNAVEWKLAAIWEEVLGVEKIGINYNFVDLGGHSLLVISIISKVHKEFGVELLLNDVFDNPTIKQLSRLIVAAEKKDFETIEPAAFKPYYAATSDQVRMYLLNELESAAMAYHIPALLQLEGPFDTARFREIIRRLSQRHEALRTSFELVDGTPVQVIHEDVDMDVTILSFEKFRPANTQGPLQREEIKALAAAVFTPFDLAVAPLFRVHLVAVAPDLHLVLIDLHHIIADGISLDILIDEFLKLYNGQELPAPTIQLKDYAEWHTNLMEGGKRNQQRDYWLKQLGGDIPRLNLPLDFPRPDVQRFEGDIFGFTLDTAVRDGLNAVIKESGATYFMVLSAVYTILLARECGQEDIIIGSIIAGRNHADLQTMIGMLVKTLVMRHAPLPEMSFQDFLLQVKTTTLDAFENQDYPFMELVDALGLKKDRSRNPLFDAVFIWQDSTQKSTRKQAEPQDGGGLSVKQLGHGNKRSKFDLCFEAFEENDGIRCAFQFSTHIFKKETILLMRDRFLALVQAVINNPYAKIGELDFMTPGEIELQSKPIDVQFDF